MVAVSVLCVVGDTTQFKFVVGLIGQSVKTPTSLHAEVVQAVGY